MRVEHGSDYFSEIKNLDFSIDPLKFDRDSYFQQRLQDIGDGELIVVEGAEGISGLLKGSPLHYEQDVFGFPCSRIDFMASRRGTPSLDTKRSLLSEFQGLPAFKNSKFYSTKVRSGDQSTLQALEEQGFSDICEYVTFHIPLTQEKYEFDRANVRVAQQKDIHQLKRIAGKEAFSHSRFYVDPRFNRKKVEEFYAQWIANSVVSPRHKVFVYDEGSGALGFIDLGGMQFEKRAGDLNLIAVEERARGKGIGKTLLNAAFDFFKKNNASDFYVETEAENKGSLILYDKYGEVITRTKVLHKWEK